MMFLWLLGYILLNPRLVYGEIDEKCSTNCTCCINRHCGPGTYFPDTCLSGCIDGHRGARCWELCQYTNCKSCVVSMTCTACYDGYYLGPNNNCTLQCPSNCKSCSSSTNCTECKEGFYNKDDSSMCNYAVCPENCECSGSNCISCKTGFYNTSSSCTSTCPHNCDTCMAKDKCDECKSTFYNGYEYDDNKGLQLNNCTYICRGTCVACHSYNICSECVKGKHGQMCQHDCSVGCKDKDCSIESGNCDCSNHFSGGKCTECVNGKYGQYCNKTCPKDCKNKACYNTTGYCIDGCISETITGTTCDTCKAGKFGELCNETCPEKCIDGKCDRNNSSCTGGCKDDFNGTFCDVCVHGKYGANCGQNCPVKCADDMCQMKNGSCYTCTGNYDGAICDTCKPGYFGPNCNETCSTQCAMDTCDRDSGVCVYGCINGYSGDRCCVKSDKCMNCSSNSECSRCNTGFFTVVCNETCSMDCLGNCKLLTGECYDCTNNHFGDFCNFTCSDKCNVSYNNVTMCAQSDGKCTYGCRDGYTGSNCNVTCSTLCIENVCEQDTGICVNGCDGQHDDTVCDKRLEKPDTDSANLTAPIAGVSAALVFVIAGILVAVVFFKRRRSRKADGSSSMETRQNLHADITGTVEERNVYANMPGNQQRERSYIMEETEEVDVEDVVVDEQEDADPDEDYYNFQKDHWKIKVADLFSYVTREHVELFAKDFQNLPKHDDLSEVCKVAKKPENIALNRYNGIYPFDHSRVTIPGQSRFFINACYIDGYNRKKAYVASFGPTEKTTDKFTTFWRMVWHEQSEIIVMLTNLREASGMKCEQYWPEKGEEHYGHIKVECRSVEVFAEYTVRIFTISKGKERRNLTHLHYTAWPDKGVPSEVTSLVEFRQRVKAVPIVLDGPVVVHCSAGVGRTGTYIALDILTNEGETEGSVKVFNCVSKMREQRVNMVQTAEQYKYLHKALVHALTFECEAIIAEEVQSLAFEADDMFNKMFRTLQYEVDKEKDYEVAAREENRKAHADKSRRHSDIPGDRGRVRLFLRRKTGSHDYINAVFINSFKIKNLFIAAQSPLSGTVEDFLCMIYQQDSSCVIALESLQQPFKQNDVGGYLPADNETYRCGSFTVTSSKCESKPQYIVKKLSIQNTEKKEDKTVYHFQYTKWGKGQNVADNARDFVHFVKDVEKYVNQSAEDTPNIVVHCLNGYERSGLFCVVYTLLEKLEAERQVSVVNIIRRVRAQRRRSISNTEQLKFCYQCISAYLESYNTYSNFAT